MKSVGKPDAGNPHVRFDERGTETGLLLNELHPRRSSTLPIALPYGLAMAALMGLPPVLGVFTSMLTAPLISAFGRNPLLVGGTSIVTAPFIAAAVRAQGVAGAAKVSILASLIMLGFGMLRLGRYVTRVPQAVISGFSCGIGATMLISQMNTILGLDLPVERNPSSTAGQLLVMIQRIGAARPYPLLLGMVVIVIATIAARWSRRVPAPLLGIVVAIIIAKASGIHEREIGTVPALLPPFVGFSLNRADAQTVLPSAFALAFVSSINILLTSRVLELCRGRHQPLNNSDADMELGAYGIANLCAGMFGAPLSVGMPARSLALLRCGGTTRLANMLHALILAIIYSGSDQEYSHKFQCPPWRASLRGWGSPCLKGVRGDPSSKWTWSTLQLSWRRPALSCL